jgi:hypothetical protein
MQQHVYATGPVQSVQCTVKNLFGQHAANVAWLPTLCCAQVPPGMQMESKNCSAHPPAMAWSACQAAVRSTWSGSLPLLEARSAGSAGASGERCRQDSRAAQASTAYWRGAMSCQLAGWKRVQRQLSCKVQGQSCAAEAMALQSYNNCMDRCCAVLHRPEAAAFAGVLQGRC